LLQIPYKTPERIQMTVTITLLKFHSSVAVMNRLPPAKDTDDMQNCTVKIAAAINHAYNPSLETNLTYYCAFTRKSNPLFKSGWPYYVWVGHMAEVEFNNV
jgi:hypothetical protein